MIVIIRLFLIGILTFESIAQYFSPQKVHILIIAIVPALFWLTFFLLEERRTKREPIFNIAYLFVMGALAALTALDIQVGIKAIMGENFVQTSPLTVISFAFIEEFIKFLFIYLAIRRSRFFDEPIDGMLDMIIGALGFAALENILFIINAPDVAGVTVFRFIGAILLHAVASGLIGFYWIKHKLFLGLVLAGLLHTIFNLLVIYSDYGIILAPFMLLIACFFLFRDFDIIKKK